MAAFGPFLFSATFFTWVGVLAVSYFIFTLISYVVYFIRMFVSSSSGVVGPHLGAWAVITGATDGIGKAYAKALAERGMKVVLISRSQEKLNQVASEIKDKFKVETKTIVADFGKPEKIYSIIKADLEGLEIGVLVNNVGVSFDFPEYFLEIPDLDKMIDNLINVNVISVLRMTQLVLPHMVERSKGIIVNISSFSAIEPYPFLSIYAASKAFVNFFSQSINLEYRRKGIIVQTVQPYFVATKMSKIRRTSLFKPTPEQYVKYSFNTLGLETETFGYPPHAFMALLVKILPKWFAVKATEDTYMKSRLYRLKNQKEN